MKLIWFNLISGKIWDRYLKVKGFFFVKQEVIAFMGHILNNKHTFGSFNFVRILGSFNVGTTMTTLDRHENNFLQLNSFWDNFVNYFTCLNVASIFRAESGKYH